MVKAIAWVALLVGLLVLAWLVVRDGRRIEETGGLVRSIHDRVMLAPFGESDQVTVELKESERGLLIMQELPEVLEAEWVDTTGTTRRVKTPRKPGETDTDFEARHDAMVASRKAKYPPKPPVAGQGN